MMRHWHTAARKPGWNRSPLRRRIDRAETAAMSVLLAALLIVGPLLAIFAGRATDAAALREQHAERGWYQVTAVLTQSVGPAVLEPGEMDVAWVRARWTERGDRQRTGIVAAPLNSQAGQRVPVWLAHSGQPAHAPLSAADVRTWVLYSAPDRSAMAGARSLGTLPVNAVIRALALGPYDHDGTMCAAEAAADYRANGPADHRRR
jgi:hypothetical protein